MINDLIIIKSDQARRLLMECTSAGQVKRIKDMANAVEVYAKRQKLGKESIDYAHTIVIDAETLLGEFLEKVPKNIGTKGSACGKVSGSIKLKPPEDSTPTLAEIGLSKQESSEAQFLSKLAKENPTAHNLVRERKKSIRETKRDLRKKRNLEIIQTAEIPKEKDWIITSDQDCIKCKAVITDPPYGIINQPWEPKDIEHVTRLWAMKWANESDANFFLIFWSQKFLWEGKHWFDESLTSYKFQQLLIWHYSNNKSPQSRQGFKQTWEPIFFYRHKESRAKIGVSSENWGNGLNDFDCHVAAVPQTNFNGPEMKVHPAQKPVSVFRWLINACTLPGELVCDPFCGSGTSGIAAVQLGRRFHGIEIDPEYKRLAEGRISAYGKPKFQ